ncbi:hypothetical protein [Aestuariivita boseongensis]|nr:hypothetical protein [Aestuariivita boseongensis]
MKAMFIAFAAMAVVAVGAYYGLGTMGWDSASRVSSDAVRLD